MFFMRTFTILKVKKLVKTGEANSKEFCWPIGSGPVIYIQVFHHMFEP